MYSLYEHRIYYNFIYIFKSAHKTILPYKGLFKVRNNNIICEILNIEKVLAKTSDYNIHFWGRITEVITISLNNS